MLFFLITNVFVQLSAGAVICRCRYCRYCYNVVAKTDSSLVCPCQNIIFLPAPSASTICQSNIQCKSDGIKGFGCHDRPLRVHEHPFQTDSSAAQFTGALLSQPPPRAASANQSCSRKSPLLPQVRFNFHYSPRHEYPFKALLCSHSQCPFK